MDNAIFLTGLGLLLFLTGLYFILRDWFYAQYGYQTQGTVVELMGRWESNQNRKQRYYYYPIIEFITAEQEVKKMVMWVGSTIEPYRNGETVSILYYKNNIYPVGTSWTVLYGILTLLGLGLVLYPLIQ